MASSLAFVARSAFEFVLLKKASNCIEETRRPPRRKRFVSGHGFIGRGAERAYNCVQYRGRAALQRRAKPQERNRALAPCDRLAISFRRQSRNPDSSVSFVTDVQSDEQRRDLLEGAGVFQFAAVDGADAGNLRGERARELSSVRVIAANNNIAVENVI